MEEAQTIFYLFISYISVHFKQYLLLFYEFRTSNFFSICIIKSTIVEAIVSQLWEVANLVTDYFLLKIKILAKREFEFTTKFANARNGC